MYGDRFLEDLKSRITLSDVIGRDVRLVRRGIHKVACCPFHKEKTPSFSVNDERGFYHCFGCGVSGDVISYTMAKNGLTFGDAVKKLAMDYGIELPQNEKKFIQEQKELNDQRQLIYRINEFTCQFFEKNIFNEEGRAGLIYIQNRGLSKDDIKKFRIGFAPNGFGTLRTHLNSLGFDDNILQTAGILASGDRGFFDKFRNRVMFPVLDNLGRVIAFSGRVINSTDMPKYMNSPETPIFHKGNTLFNYYHASKAISASGQALLVEGNLDAIGLAIKGVENAVAPMGTAITTQQ